MTRSIKRTLSALRQDKLPDEFVRGLRVQRQGVAQRLQVWALLQEGLLQANATGVEVLLRTHKRRPLSLHRSQTPANHVHGGLSLSWFHTLIVSSANSITAHCLGVKALASSRPMCSCRTDWSEESVPAAVFTQKKSCFYLICFAVNGVAAFCRHHLELR